MPLLTKLAKFKRHESGATTIEFAFVCIPFFLVFMAILEYGLFLMTQVALESAVSKAGRASAISMNTDTSTVTRVQQTEGLVLSYASGLMNYKDIYFEENTVANGGTTAQDMCFDQGLNKPPNPTAATCNCSGCVYIEGNGQNGYQQPTGSANTGGKDGDLVEIRAIYPWHVMFPFISQYFGTNGIVLINSTTVIKNE